MDFPEEGETTDAARDNRGTLALKRLMELGRVPLRFVTTYILIKGYGRTWRECAEELGLERGAIGYHLRQVKGALERLLVEEPDLY